MKKELKPSDVKRLAKICNDVNKKLSFKNPLMEGEKKELEKESKRFRRLLEYKVPSDETRLDESTLAEIGAEKVVYLSGKYAVEAFDVMVSDNVEAAFDYLKEWHESDAKIIKEGVHIGLMDKTYTKDGYTMFYNSNLGYIGLSQKITK